ncbi:MAG: hypothetical protein FJZ56_03520, partial [Chlamydiae bacterium]|nr:hypothetical protein [Chlamydiota bacterium]
MTIGQKLVSDMGVSQKDYDHFILDLDQIKKESNSYVRQTMKGEVSAHYLTTFHSQELADIMEVKIEDLSTKAVDFKTHVEQFDLYTQTLINRLEKSATCPESKYRYCAIKNQLNTIQDEIEVLYVAVEKSIKIAERMFFPRFIELSDSLEGFLSSSALNSPKFVKQELYRFCRKMSAITLDIEDQIRLSNPDFE